MTTKSHYKIYYYKKVIYWFTTTKRNLEDCLNLIQGKWGHKKYYRVLMNGTEVYDNLKNFKQDE